MSEFWSESLADVVDGVVVCAICGQPECGAENDQRDRPDSRLTKAHAPLHAVDEPAEEVR